MIIKKVARNLSADYEFGCIQSMKIGYEAVVTFAECGNEIDTAFELVSQRFSDGFARLSISLREKLSDYNAQGMAFVFDITVEKLNYALREDALYWNTTYTGSVTTEQSNLIYEFPEAVSPGSQPDTIATVEYNGDVQVASFQKYVPLAEISCMGIFSKVYTPAWLHDVYLGSVNKASFRGYGPRVVMCVQANVEPFDVGRQIGGTVQEKYKYTFRFSVKPDGWGPWVYYVDPGTGLPPPDLEYGVGYGQLQPPLGSPYKNIDFNAIWPFTERTSITEPEA